MKINLIIIIIISLFISSCGMSTGDIVSKTKSSTDTSTKTEIPTNTNYPTYTRYPTYTIYPTYTNYPTYTIIPSNTNIITSTITQILSPTIGELDTKLLLWNKLGSEKEIESSEVGPGGKYISGQFVAGVYGQAVKLDYLQQNQITFPKEIIPIKAGTIEFWAKLSDMPIDLEWGEKPALIKISDGQSEYGIHFNGNDGAGNGGLCGWAGYGYTTGTDWYGDWTYEAVLGQGLVENWHHYALVWDSAGIKGVDNGKRKIAIYLDGKLESGRWQIGDGNQGDNGAFIPITGGSLGLFSHQGMSQGQIIFDNLIIWNYAKTTFSLDKE